MSQVGDKIITKQVMEVDFDSASEMSAEEVDKVLERTLISMKDVNSVFNTIVGETLTVIDASLTDKEQKKAVKDLIKHSMYDGLDTLHALTDKS